MSSFQTINPYNGDVIKKHRYLLKTECDQILVAAYDSFKIWRLTGIEERSRCLLRLAGALRKNADVFAESMTREMGKPLSQSRAEVEKCAIACEFYAENALKFLSAEIVEGPFENNEINFAPMGPILAIMPWNYPLWQLVRVAAPALLVGNTLVVKPSDITAGTSELFEVVTKSIFSTQLIWHAPMTHEDCEVLISHHLLRGVSFTGSTGAGRKIAETAAKNLKKHVIELGGSDPYIVLQDAEIEKAAAICAKARLVNSGQSCIAAKRIIVEEAIFEEFLAAFSREMMAAKVGNPMEISTEIGPLAAKRFQNEVVRQVEYYLKLGGKLIGSALPPVGNAAFFLPAIIAFEKNYLELGQQEIFGPVALVIKARSAEDSVAIANSAIFGLGGAIFTKNLRLARQMASQLECGFVAINRQVVSDPALPFGGVKDSGYGRELSRYGMLEFCNIKSVGSAE